MKKFIQKHFKKLFYLSLIGLVLVFGINFYVKSKTNFLIFYSENKIPKNKVGIIFGAGINGDKPSKYLKDRLDAGIKLFKAK